MDKGSDAAGVVATVILCVSLALCALLVRGMGQRLLLRLARQRAKTTGTAGGGLYDVQHIQLFVWAVLLLLRPPFTVPQHFYPHSEWRRIRKVFQFKGNASVHVHCKSIRRVRRLGTVWG